MATNKTVPAGTYDVQGLVEVGIFFNPTLVTLANVKEPRLKGEEKNDGTPAAKDWCTALIEMKDINGVTITTVIDVLRLAQTAFTETKLQACFDIYEVAIVNGLLEVTALELKAQFILGIKKGGKFSN